MKYHIKNCKVLNEKYEIIDAEVITGGGEIKAVGSGLITPDSAEVIDAKGNLIMPGLKDAHTHSAMTLLRGYAEDLPLNDWLFKKVFPFEDKMTPEDVYWGTKLAILEYLRNGITSIGEMYKHTDSFVKAANDCGFRITCVGAVDDLNKDTEGALNKLEKEYNNYNSGLTKYMLGYHAEYTASDKLFSGIGELAKRYCAPVGAHMSETHQEVEKCLKNRGTTPFMLADKYGVFDYGGVIYHGVYLTAREMDIAKEKKVFVVTNPSSNLKLSSGIAPLIKMNEKGLRIAIGTDGPANNNSLDMFREMYLVSVLQKNASGDPAQLPAKKVIDMCINNGADCLSIKNTAQIAKHCAADLIMVDINSPNMRPRHDIINNLVFSCTGANVLMTMINGKILYKEGRYYLEETAEQICENCEFIAARIKQELI